MTSKIIVSCIFACALSACGQRPVDVGFDRRAFSSDRFTAVVGFDLRTDRRPKAALLLRLDAFPVAQLQMMTLPFSTSSVEQVGDIALAAGVHQDYTVLAFARAADASGLQAVQLDPVYQNELPDSFARPERTLYLAANGQERTFAYIQESARRRSSDASFAEAVSTKSVDALAVAIPERARRIETDDSDKPADTLGPVRFYRLGTSGNATSRVVVRYLVPLTSVEQVVSGFLLKLFGLVAPPLIALALLRGDEVSKPALRRAVLIMAVAVEGAAIVGVGYYSLTIGGQTALQMTLDGVAILIAGTLTVIGLVVKKAKPAGP